MALTGSKRLVLLVFCLGSVIQGMCSTYFVSILTTIERLYHIQSKTAGALMSATELGQIIGSLLIAYYGGRGNKPRLLAICMALTASAALLSTSPHFLFNTQQTFHNNNNSLSTAKPPLSDKQLNPTSSNSVLLDNIPAQQLCRLDQIQNTPTNVTTSLLTPPTSNLPLELDHTALRNQRIALVIFAITLLVVGLSCTSIVTIGFPLIDDYISKKESPMVFGLTIALKVFGPALGFLLGSFCMRYDVNLFSLPTTSSSNINQTTLTTAESSPPVGAWWLGPILISVPLFILASAMYLLSHLSLDDDELTQEDLEDITYQAAEDHSLGGSNEFRPNVLSAEVLDITSSLSSSFSNEASSSKEVLQSKESNMKLHKFYTSNFKSNISLGRPIITRENLIIEPLTKGNSSNGQQVSKKINSIVVHHSYGNSRSTNFINEEAADMNSPCIAGSSSASLSSPSSAASSSLSLKSSRQSSGLTMNLFSSLSRLFNNKLLILRTLSGVFHILPIAGFYTFLPKYLSEQFQVAPSNASAISGLFGILFVGIGTLLGGTIVRVFNVNSKLMTRWIAMSALLYSIGMLLLMNLGCPKNQIIHSENNLLIPKPCIKFCECSDDIFNPVCLNGTTFIGPCTAGCQSYSIKEGKVIYQNCACSKQPQDHQLFINQPANLEVSEGPCSIGCDNFIWYIMIFSICTIIHSSSEVGGMIFNLRCVDEEDRTLALGLNTFSQSLLGTIPCSILYGTLIDFTCIFWDKISYLNDGQEVSTRGACRAYQNDEFHYYLHGMTALVMFIAFLIDSIVSRHSNKVNFYMENESHSNVTIDLKESTEAL